MSLSNTEANSGTSPSRSGGSSIRLPPISFLSRTNENETGIPAIGLSIGQRPFENQQPQSQQRDSEAPNLQRSAGPGAFANDNNEDAKRMKLPTPHVLGLYPGQSGSSSAHTEENNQFQLSNPPPDGQKTTQVQQENDLADSAANDESYQLQHHLNHHHNGSKKYSRQYQHHHYPHLHLHKSQSEDDNTGEKRVSKTQIEGPIKKVRGLSILNKEALQRILREVYPQRHHLGTIIYNPTTSWETLQIEQLHGLQEHDKQRLLEIRGSYLERTKETFFLEEVSYIPVLPPLSETYINCFLEVKIPYRFIKSFVEDFTAGRIQRRRELWGGLSGIYTDDSDLLSVLCHLGLFDDNLDLTESNSAWTKEDLVRPLKVHHDEEGVELLDLSVTLLLLPTLKEYHGFHRNGLNSRSWVGDSPHDGLSFSVFNVKWETYVTSTGDRNLSKLAQKENLLDRLVEQKLIQEGQGWKFDCKYFKDLQEKYKKHELPKEVDEASNGA